MMCLLATQHSKVSRQCQSSRYRWCSAPKIESTASCFALLPVPLKLRPNGAIQIYYYYYYYYYYARHVNSYNFMKLLSRRLCVSE